MPELVVVPELLNTWPEAFKNAWANIRVSHLNNTVFSLYFNNINSEGTILEDPLYLEIPEAYISINPDGYIIEIYVKKEYRRNKIGTMLCAWTRTNFIDRNIEVKPPMAMTESANELYQYLASEYGEPYNSVGSVPMFSAYTDFKPISIFDLEKID